MQRSLSAVLFVSIFALSGVVVPTAVDAGEKAAQNASSTGLVLINELANGGVRSDSDTFFELRNWDDHAIDLSGWGIYRCSPEGLRSNIGRPETELRGVILEPGEIYTVSRTGMPGNAHGSQPLDLHGFGLYLEGPDDELVDAIGVYPNEPWPTQSECTVGRNLPNSLNFAQDESWQRIGVSGNLAADFVAAPSTLGVENETAGLERAATTVIISEFAAAGAASSDDEFVELRNGGTRPADIGGWQLYRCTATGRLRTDTLQYTVPRGTIVEAGKYFVFGGPGFEGEVNARYSTGLADITSGVYLATATGQLADRISVSAYADSACQDGDEKLPAELDYVAGESWQWSTTGFLIAPRTPGEKNATTASSLAATEFSYAAGGGVAISELATDPWTPEFEQHNYIELGNYGDTTVSLAGWTLRRCEASGLRSRELQVTIPAGTSLGPGETFLAAKRGSTGEADAEYATTLNFLGTGVWVEDARGRLVDSVGVFAANEMDQSNVTGSVCTRGMSLTTYQPDRTKGETFQRTRFTGSNAADFITAKATPGVLDEHEWVDPTARVVEPALVEPIPLVELVETVPTALVELVETVPTALVELVETVPTPLVELVETLESWSGVSDAPLATRVGPNETPSTGTISDDAWAYPYERFVLDAGDLKPGSTVHWTGSTVARNEVQFSVWDGAAWRLLDAGTGAGTGGEFRLTGILKEGDLADGTVTLLAQNGPRTKPTLDQEANGQLETPGNYDFAVSHITDTQYLSESYPEVYTGLVSWIADNAEARDIEFATHTGDLVQNWVDPDQSEQRARIEFERASAVQGILDGAGVPNSVLPGNHDNKRGVSNDLYNEYFGPERYEDSSWYEGSIASGDNSANYSTFEHEGARFLMLSLPYAYGEAEIAWAQEIVTSHASYNVIVSTHEHVTPSTEVEQAQLSVNSRWVSRAQDLWDRVIAPNRNVVVVLSGHFHGLGQILTENAGGIEGHDVVELLADYQEFRTHSGERATGFQRLLQIDLASSTIAVDTFAIALGESSSFEYDYLQFVPDSGMDSSRSNIRPWNIVSAGVQHRYTAADDEFWASAGFQYPKLVATASILTAPPSSTQLGPTVTSARGAASDWARLLRSPQS